MKRFRVKVATSGMIFMPRSDKSFRTPATINVNEKELQVLKVQFKAKGLKYTIEDVTEDGIDKPEIPSVYKKVIIEELIQTQTKNKTTEPKSFLDKLILDEEN